MARNLVCDRKFRMHSLSRKACQRETIELHNRFLLNFKRVILKNDCLHQAVAELHAEPAVGSLRSGDPDLLHARRRACVRRRPGSDSLSGRLATDYFKLIHPPDLTIDETAWDAVLTKYHIDTVLWVKAHEQLRRFLAGKRGWKEEYAGLYESIYVKP